MNFEGRSFLSTLRLPIALLKFIVGWWLCKYFSDHELKYSILSFLFQPTFNEQRFSSPSAPVCVKVKPAFSSTISYQLFGKLNFEKFFCTHGKFFDNFTINEPQVRLVLCSIFHVLICRFHIWIQDQSFQKHSKCKWN